MTTETSDLALSREAYRKAQREAQAAAMNERLALTEDAPLKVLLPQLDGDNLTMNRVCEYFGVTRSTIGALYRVYGEELAKAGFKAPIPRGSGARFSRRSVLHLALLLRPSSSAEARRLKAELGVAPPQNKGSRMAHHVSLCKTMLEQASDFAEAIQDLDPAAAWNDLTGMDRWDVQALTVTLAAMVKLDQPGAFAYLVELGAKMPVAARTERADSAGTKDDNQHAARGLAALIPVTRSEFDEGRL